MTTNFITVEVNLQTPRELNQAIEAELLKHGTPLRWAITHLDSTQQTAIIEAIVTCE
jgi:hypothetical protein